MGIRIVCDACHGPIGEDDAIYCEGCYDEELVESLQVEIEDLENELVTKEEELNLAYDRAAELEAKIVEKELAS